MRSESSMKDVSNDEIIDLLCSENFRTIITHYALGRRCDRWIKVGLSF